MTEVRLRARSVSELVDAAFALYRRDSGQYIMVMAIAAIPQLVAGLFLRPGVSFGLGSAMLLLISSLASAFTYTMGAAAITKLGSAVYLGEQSEMDAALRAVIPKVMSILWAGFLKAILYFIGTLFFLVGEFYVAARYFAVTSAIVLEDASASDAFSRSTVLSLGRKWHILNTLLLVYIIYFLLALCVGVVAAFSRSGVVVTIASTAFSIVAYPIVGLTTMLLYYDCRIRNEGFDIERMAAAMGGDSGSAPGMAGATP
jgi:hypothetical protein